MYTKSVAKAPYFVLIHKKLMPLNQIGNTIYTEMQNFTIIIKLGYWKTVLS